jgi:hypothetical protein
LAETFGFPVLPEVATNDGRISAMAFLASSVSLVIIPPYFQFLTSFHPQMVFLPNLSVNLRVCL